MSANIIRIDAYFGSGRAAKKLERVLGRRALDAAPVDTVGALSALGWGNAESSREWGDFLCHRTGSKLTLEFITSAGSTEDWEKPLVRVLTEGGATHVLIDLINDQVGERFEYGYTAGKQTTAKKLLEALQAIDPSLALLEAVERKRLGQVKKLLAEGADPNASGRVPATVLAVRAESSRVLEALLRAGAEANRAARATGETALHRCADLGEHETRDELAEILTRHGADPNLRDKDGWSPLLLAADHGSARLTAILLRNGGDANARHADGRTAAMIAAGSANDGLGVLRALEAHGADLTALDGGGRDGFFYALPRLELEEYLLAHGLERYVPEEEYTGDPVPDLFTAIRYNHIEKVEALVRDETLACARFDPGVPNVYQPALFRATEIGRIEIVRLLLERGADPDAVGGYGPLRSTALWKAAHDGRERIVAALIEAGADLEIGSGAQGPPLMAAASRNHTGIVRRLLEAGADPGAESRGRNLLELLLVRAGGPERARQLVESLGGRVGLEPAARYRLLENALHNGRHWLARYLAEEGLAIRASDLARAILKDDLESFEILLPFFETTLATGVEEEGEQVPWPPLAACCQRLVKSPARGPVRENQRQMFRAILALGVDVDRPTVTRQTALFVLQGKKGFVEETRALLGAGADPNRLVGSDLGGKLYGEFAALHAAAYYGLVENCRALIEAGADVGMIDGDGCHGTALMIARARGKKKVVELLLQHGAKEWAPGRA